MMLFNTILSLLFLLIAIHANESSNNATELQEKELYDHVEEMKELRVRKKRSCCNTCPPGRDCGCGDCSSFHNLQCRPECMPACEKYCIQGILMNVGWNHYLNNFLLPPRSYEIQTMYEIQQPRVCMDQCMPKCEPTCVNRINIAVPQSKCHDLCMPTCSQSCLNRLIVEVPQPRCQEMCMPSCLPSCTQQIVIPVPQRKCIDPCMPACLPTCTSQEIIITQPAPMPSCGVPQCPTCAPDCVSKYNVQVAVPQHRCHEACQPSCHSRCIEAMSVFEIQVQTANRRCPDACQPSCNNRCVEAVSMLEIQVSTPSCGIPECPRCEAACVEKYRPQPTCHYACRPHCTQQCVQYIQTMEVKISPNCGIKECPTCESSCVERYRAQVVVPTQNCVSYCQPQCAPQCVQAFSHHEVSSNNGNNGGSPRKISCTSVPCTCPVGYIQCSQSECCLMYFNMAKKYSKRARKQHIGDENNIDTHYRSKKVNFRNEHMNGDNYVMKKNNNSRKPFIPRDKYGEVSNNK